MSDLRIDGDALREAAAHIRQVIDSFATAGSDAHDAAALVGHAGLASRVKEFADGWDIHRGRLGDELRQVAEMLEAVDDTFADLDRQTAQTVRRANAAATGGDAPGTHKGVHDPVPSLAARLGS